MDALRIEARPLVRVETRGGRVSVRFEERSDILVETHNPRRAAELNGSEVTFRASNRIELRLPSGTNLNVGTISGRVELHGRAGDVRIVTASGSIHVEAAERADVRSVSGGIRIDECGDCRLQSKSGRVEIGRARRAQVATVSGRIQLAHATGEVRVKTVSGRVEIGAAGQNDVSVQTISGSVLVRLPEGTRPHVRARNLVGRSANAFSEGDDCRIAVQTLSGKIELAAI